MCWFYTKYAFLLIAFICSSFYGSKAHDIFDIKKEGKPWAWRLHEWWLNFAGAFAGWAALYFLVVKLVDCFPNCFSQFTLSQLVVFGIAFIGITGHLPVTIVSVIYSLRDLAKKLSGGGGT